MIINFPKYFFSLALVCLLTPVAQAQSQSSLSASRAENAALSLQIKQQKEAVAVLKQTLDDIKAAVEDTTTGLSATHASVDAVDNQINNTSTGLKAEVTKIKDRVPVMALSERATCFTRDKESCNISCYTKKRIKGGGYATSYQYVVRELKKVFDLTSEVKLFNPHVSRPVYLNNQQPISRVPGVYVHPHSATMTCYAMQINSGTECVQTQKTCVSKNKWGCQKYENKCIKTKPVYKYVDTTCAAQCGAVGYRKAKK